MLVELSVSTWAGRKLDKRASQDVAAQNHANTGVANVHKKLLPNSDELQAIQNHAKAMRTMNHSITMPWSNSGLRLLPTAQYMRYHKEITGMQAKFFELVEDFLHTVNDKIIDAQLHLGDMFDPSEYPSIDELRGKFACRLNYMPLPDAGDFRLDIANDAMREVKEQYEAFYTQQYERAMNDVWQRTYEVLQRMSERLDYGDHEQKKIFRDSLVENVVGMIDLLRVSNVTNSTQMTAMADRLEATITGVTPDALREDEYLRAETKRAVDEAIKALPSLDM